MTRVLRCRAGLFVAIVAAASLFAGCAPGTGAELAIRQEGLGAERLAGGFDFGTYHHDGTDQATIVLVDGPVDAPRQAVTMRVFWKSRAGKTPVARAATNATIHYVIFAGDGRAEAGVYSGAGFVYLPKPPGEALLGGDLREATLRISDASPGFTDLLGRATINGQFNARLDAPATRLALRQLTTQLRARLGYPRLVKAPPTGTLSSPRMSRER